MRKYIFFTLIFLSSSFSLLHAGVLGPSDAAIAYFNALKNGDVETIKEYIAGDYYEKYKVLLEENKGYPDFLRNFYKGAEFDVLSTARGNNDDVIVQVQTYFADGSTAYNKLRLKNFDKDGWKIVEEIVDY